MQRLAKIRLPRGKLSVWLYDPQGRATCLSSKHGPLDASKVPDWAVKDAGVKREIIALAAHLDGLPAVQRVQRTLQREIQ
jgi:hypothetical protein